MFKTLTAAIAAVFISTAASAVTIDAFDLDVKNASGTDSTAVLALGQTYRITVSGTFTLGTNEIRHIADAEYFNLGSDPLVPLDRTSAREIGVGIDGVDIDFGAFNPSRVYTALIEGKGSTINVFYSDSPLSDNEGSLQVTISAVPLPAGILLMASGLAGFGLIRRRQS
jgi:hypothetical protein